MAQITEKVRYDQVTPGNPYIPYGGVLVGPSGNIALTTEKYLGDAVLDMHLAMSISGNDPVKIPGTEIVGAVGTNPAVILARGLTPGLSVTFVVTKLVAAGASVSISMISGG